MLDQIFLERLDRSRVLASAGEKHVLAVQVDKRGDVVVPAPAGCLVVDVWADTWNNSWMVPVTQLFGHYYLPLEFPADAERSQPVLLGDAVIGQSHFYTVDIETLISALESTIQRLGIERAGVA